MWKTGQILSDGTDAGLTNAMHHWAEKLGGYKDHPETIKRALENLPADPPTLPQFCEIMRHSWVEPKNLQITKQWTQDELEKNKQRAAEAIAKVREMMRMAK